MQTILVTGAAGFIGYHVAKRCLDAGMQVVGMDNLNQYYDVTLKKARLACLTESSSFEFVEFDLNDRDAMGKLFEDRAFDKVVHLGAQAGVRYSVENPHVYVDSNLMGTLNVLEGCRRSNVTHLVYASSSSVYGSNTSQPFSVSDSADHPLSLYAATKKATEMMAHSYSHLYGLPTTGLRFFTVYGPWGRPDMALFKFTKAILEGHEIEVYNAGKMRRDFTYVDDLAKVVTLVLEQAPLADPNWNSRHPDPGSSSAPFRIYNVGNQQPTELIRFIEVLEDTIGIKAKKRMLPIQAGDVLDTFADVDSLAAAIGFSPSTPIEIGIPKFVAWYREYYHV
ncbi:MAG: NAD-dependent epimerase [Planctomycetota bacterium]|nr:NAD-dependent epimerase [Planctomycetota bacterium]